MLSIDEARDAIDVELSVLRAEASQTKERREESETRIRDLHRQRNFLAPISRLVDKTFTLIFIFLRYGLDLWPSTTTKSIWHLDLTICSHWRQIALRSPVLWADIRGKSQNKIHYMLLRAKSHPLRFTWNEKALPALKGKFIASLIPRCRVVHIEFHTTASVKDFAKYLRSPAPHLTILSLETDDGRDLELLHGALFRFLESASPTLQELSITSLYGTIPSSPTSSPSPSSIHEHSIPVKTPPVLFGCGMLKAE
ncbi:hypothetical protein DL96DRAFT_789553 [Flagelloscypha sp. PMI_526]|nr:hypothetical protein DL96DRAFT_789553 [Flagelloscypha sp. PMI_526]